MGNEKSSYAKTRTEETIEESENWTQQSATFVNSNTKICVFKQSLSNKKVRNLQSLSQNLKLYRHPHIPRFISTWQSNGSLFLATELVKPLKQILCDFMPMQRCIGLRNILNAMTFLHQTAMKSHNNLSLDAIYVNSEGCWKLGGLELLTSLQPSHIVDDQQEFAKVALQILNEVEENDVPGIMEFKDHCTHHASDPNFLLQLSSHLFFNHEFVNIYTFLTELPVKCEEEKSHFFKTLPEILATFPEVLVARQFSALLLSRLVVLNDVAQTYLLPKIFKARSDNCESLFSHDILKEYVQPRLLYMFGLRDSQIRLILLRYFSLVCSIFTKQQLESKILPELLVGIKDTNEQLVAATLRALADLVPVLGASVVIGQHQTKLFADGRPLKTITKMSEEVTISNREPRDINEFILIERPSPDGGEDLKQVSSTINEKVDSVDIESKFAESESTAVNSIEENTAQHTMLLSKKQISLSVLRNDDDLCSLDVKVSRAKNDIVIDDIELMFKDMEPIISRPATIEIEKRATVLKNKFDAVDVDIEAVHGWGEDESDLIDSELL